MSLMTTLRNKKAEAKSEGGFSLIDVVVTVAIIVALSVGGFIAYTGLVQNAKNSATEAAVDQTYTAALVAANDGFGSDVNAAYTDIETKYNGLTGTTPNTHTAPGDAVITVDIEVGADGGPYVTAQHHDGGEAAARGQAPTVANP